MLCRFRLAGADVENRVARLDVGGVEDAVADRSQVLERARLLLGIAAEPMLEEPIGPAIPLRREHDRNA